MKSIQVEYDVWKALKQEAMDRDMTIAEIVKMLVKKI